MRAGKGALSTAQMDALDAMVACQGNQSAAARKLQKSRENLRYCLKVAREKAGVTWETWKAEQEQDFTVAGAPPQDVSIEELLRRRRETDAVQAGIDEDAKLIPITFSSDAPLGILFFGDPHVDDPRTDWHALEADIDLVRDTDGLYAANIGDTTNNWIGRLAGKYADQDVSKRQAFMLAEWMIDRLGPKSIITVGGNHDVWSGAGDPLEWLHSRIPGRYVPHEARVELRFPSADPIKMALHHSFDGASIYNPTHAQTKAAKFHYHDYRLLISGHKHVSGYACWPHWSGLIHHVIQVASYKRTDDYAHKLGKMPQFMSPSVLAVIHPQADTEAGLIQVFHDRKAGAGYLNALRSKSKSERKIAKR